MVDDALLEREHLDDGEWAITPQPEHLIPASIERERKADALTQQLGPKTSAYCITHTDADGLTSGALITHLVHEWAMAEQEIAVTAVDYNGAWTLGDALDTLAASEHTDSGVLYITDLGGPEDDRIIELLAEFAGEQQSVVWYDHHQWDPETRDAVEATGTELIVDTEECTASLIEREERFEYPPTLQDLAACTKDRDLWIRDDPRSDRLATFAEIADPLAYIETVLEHGADLPDEVQARIDDRQAQLETLTSLAVDRAVTKTVGEYTVAVTYTRAVRTSDIGNALVEDGDADIAIVQKATGSVGIYSHSNLETFAKCHEIAAELGGGGHPTAAGCEIDFRTFRQLADYWVTAGTTERTLLLAAVEQVVCGGEEP